MLTYKHKTHAVDTDGKIISNADVDFYIDDVRFLLLSSILLMENLCKVTEFQGHIFRKSSKFDLMSETRTPWALVSFDFSRGIINFSPIKSRKSVSLA